MAFRVMAPYTLPGREALTIEGYGGRRMSGPGGRRPRGARAV